MKTAIQLHIVGMQWVPRAFLYQKTHRLRRAGGWATEWTRKETEWRHLATFDPPRWCRLEDKPVESVEKIST
jgi:hypothetical protein